MSPADLYDQDFFEWTVRNAELLRAGRVHDADLTHIAEEIEGMGKRERRELLSRLSVLMAHLVKWEAQPERRSGSWVATIRLQRSRLKKLLTAMPSLRPFLVENLAEAYQEAVLTAIAETNLPEEAFPSVCGYHLEALLDDEFLP